jgi:hypothetical protein
VLQQSVNIWFKDKQHLEVIVLIDTQVSHYFKRQRMFPAQEMLEEQPDVPLVVTFRVGRFEAIRNVIKSRIPNIVILEPEHFRKDFLKDVKSWVERQEING